LHLVGFFLSSYFARNARSHEPKTLLLLHLMMCNLVSAVQNMCKTLHLNSRYFIKNVRWLVYIWVI